MNSAFSEQILADKLTKLNNTQQCIETLSHWCIFHQKKADLVVATWNKQFHSSENSKKVAFLYLANDILQNSKRKGTEFVNEFWKVLPAAIKDVNEKCDEHGKTVVSRLVNIWEDRKVFGSQSQSLRDLMLGQESLPPLELGRKRSRSVKIIKRDSRSIRTKLTIGGTIEKIVSAFHSVVSEHSDEDVEMSKCKSAVKHLRKMEKDVDIACSRVGEAPNKRTSLANEVEDQEKVLKQCTEKLKSIEETRMALVSQLRGALHEQESELENCRTQLQVAHAQMEEASYMKKRLRGEKIEAPKKSAAEIAAEVADKLAASSSSQYIMSSVLSTFAAEAAKSAGLATSSTPSNSFSSGASFTDTRNILEKPSNMFVAAPSQQLPSSYAQQLTSQYQTTLVQPMIQTQASSAQTQYHVLPNPSSQQYAQQSVGVVTSGLPYAYASFPPLPPGPPPPPPLSTRIVTPSSAQQVQIPQTPQQPMHLIQQSPVQQSMSLIQQAPVQQSMPLIQQPSVQQSMPMIQQPPVPPSFRPLQPPGMMYYINPNQPQ